MMIELKKFMFKKKKLLNLKKIFEKQQPKLEKYIQILSKIQFF